MNRKWIIWLCHGASGLAPLGWVFFTLYTRNSFQLEEFHAGRLAVCLVLSLAPAVLFFLAQALGRETALSGLLAGGCFLLAAALWMYTLAGQWGLWNHSVTVGAIAAGQRNILRTAAVCGAASGTLPPVYLVITGRWKKR